MVLLETLSPEERAALVLREVLEYSEVYVFSIVDEAITGIRVGRNPDKLGNLARRLNIDTPAALLDSGSLTEGRLVSAGPGAG